MNLARTVAASALGASVILSGVSMAAPAQAAGGSAHCKTSKKSFNLPSKPDVSVALKICGKYAGSWSGYRHYKAWVSKVSWSGTQWFIGGERFNDFAVDLRLEHGGKGIGTSDSLDRNFASDINDNESGSKSLSPGHYSSVNIATKKTRWTADATVDFDISGDGKGYKKWGLAGTSAFH
ncbi:hypothetical protein [Streptomyces sp. NPDC048248]|uniref:hypothetical protein n=1 Tax=Streptomyces sp. NPDC048248 TaxID=3365523 RepID=UPI003720D363